MASLRSPPLDSADPKLGLGLELLDYERSRSDGKINFDWVDIRLWIEIFGLRVERQELRRSLYTKDARYLIEWLRKVPGPDVYKSFEPTEPSFEIDFQRLRGGVMFDVIFLISAYGIVDGFYSTDSGVSVRFPVRATQIRQFADDLESELKGLESQHAQELVQWNARIVAETENRRKRDR